MKFDKDLHIINKTKCEKNEVTRTLIGLGFKWFSPDDKYLSINVSHKEVDFMTCVNWDVWPNSDVLTHQQFMEKYAMTDLKSKIEQVKQELGYKYLSYLSIDLGYAHNYLGRVLTKGLEAKAETRLIAKLDGFLELHKKELTHDFEGKALNKKIDDAMMVPKSEYEGLHKDNASLKEQNANLFNENSIKDFQINQLKKEIDHKTQIAEKHADMRNKAELRVSELEKECGEKDAAIKQQLLNSGNQVFKINELENQVKSLQKDCLNLTSDNDDLEEKYGIILKKYEKKFENFWTVSRENIELINSKRAISIWLAISILIIVAMLAFGVLHFNRVV